MTKQGPMQIAGMAASIGIALVTGAATGYLVSIPIFDRLTKEDLYDDDKFWLVRFHNIFLYDFYFAIIHMI